MHIYTHTYPTTLQTEGVIKTFSEKEKLREIVVNGPDLQDILRGVLYPEIK